MTDFTRLKSSLASISKAARPMFESYAVTSCIAESCAPMRQRWLNFCAAISMPS